MQLVGPKGNAFKTMMSAAAKIATQHTKKRRVMLAEKARLMDQEEKEIPMAIVLADLASSSSSQSSSSGSK